MTRGPGRCSWGEQLSMSFPQAHHETRALVAGLRISGIAASMVLDGPINGGWFEAYVTQVRLPERRPGDLVIMDNLSTNKRAAVKEKIEAAGVIFRFFPLYSPDFSTTEKEFSRLEDTLRKAGGRNAHCLWNLIGKLGDIFQPAECTNCFRSCVMIPNEWKTLQIPNGALSGHPRE